jgi:putative endonuclease
MKRLANGGSVRNVIPKGVKRASVFISSRVALRDLAFAISYVYMMCSSSRRALYTGVTIPLYKRVWEHKNKLGGYFTSKYKCHRLVYVEEFTNINTAIAREKQVKGWRREKKNQLVESMNPE